MTPEQFIGHWSPGGGGYAMTERGGAQPHFIGLCQLLGVDAPNDAENYTFEKGTLKLGQRRGFADVFKRGCFGWEYKAPGGDLVGALRQLKDYANALDNPPLLVVSDRHAFEIYTQFTGRPTETYRVALKQLGDPEQRQILRCAFTDPASFQPKRTNRDITEAAAKAFADVAERMRNERREPPERVAHFLAQCLFCFFAEDVGLLPERLFEKLVAKQITPSSLRGALIELFDKMQRGGLFHKIDVPMITPMDVAALKTASTLNWSAIDVAIFGTLFERGLDPKKRSQLGAHYTDPATIMRIVTPVVERPLRAEWAVAREEIATLRAKSKKYNDAAYLKAKAATTRFLERLAHYRVLDPACGSGNFLYLALKTLKDIEHSIHLDIQTLQLDRPVDLVVSPANVLGIEINEYAAELARVTVWIGDLQWRLQDGYPFKQNPVLEPLDHIECRDALLAPQGDTTPARPERSEGFDGGLSAASDPSLRLGGTVVGEALWPRADAVIGNPPFVGDSKKRRELGDETFVALAKIYEGRVPPGADLVCYWFDKALQQMKRGELARAGLVSTNSIRGGSNRDVLDAIVKDGAISEAWSDEPWVNDGAAVRVSLISFVLNTSDTQNLNGEDVQQIYADLTGDAEADGAGAAVDLTNAAVLIENANAVFEGLRKDGPLEVDGPTARRWLRAPNPNGRSNAVVIFPLINGMDITRRPRGGWVIDTGEAMSEADAAFFEQPFRQLTEVVRPVRAENNNRIRRTFWWRFGRSGERLRAALKPIRRYINTPRVAKHRLFVLQPHVCIPDTATVAIARADDATFGILHSRFHEL